MDRSRSGLADPAGHHPVSAVPHTHLVHSDIPPVRSDYSPGLAAVPEAAEEARSPAVSSADWPLPTDSVVAVADPMAAAAAAVAKRTAGEEAAMWDCIGVGVGRDCTPTMIVMSVVGG